MKYFKFKLPKSFSGWTIFVFGVLALTIGFIGLLYPDSMLYQLGFKIIPQTDRTDSDYTIVFITTSSMASFNMGIYYIMAAGNNLKQFFAWTVPFRILTFIIFSMLIVFKNAPMSFFSIAGWELAGAVITAIALATENNKAKG